MDIKNNCLALQALGSSMKTLLGPAHNIKCFIDEKSHDSGLLLEPLQILEAFTSSEGFRHGYPTNQLLYESSQGQLKECGCGVTTLICLTAFWAEGILKLTQEGVPLPVTFDLFEESLQLCDPLYISLAVSMDTIHKDLMIHHNKRSHDQKMRFNKKQTSSKPVKNERLLKIKNFSRHFSSVNDTETPPTSAHTSNDQCSPVSGDVLKLLSSALSHGKPQAMQLAVEAIEMQCAQGKLDITSILHYCVVGRGQSSSRVVPGVVMTMKRDMFTLLTSDKVLRDGLRIMVIAGDCTPDSAHPGLQKRAHVTSHDPGILFEEKWSSQWVSQCADVLDKLQVGVVIVGGVMSPLLWEHCLARGILVLTDVHQKQLQAICRLSRATPLYYLQHAHKGAVGECVSVEMVEGGWALPKVLYKEEGQVTRNYLCHITGSHINSPVVTAMLYGTTESTVDLFRQHFQNSLHRINCSLSDGSVLPGGGAFEAICVRTIRQNADKVQSSSSSGSSNWMFNESLLSHWRPTVYHTVADGLVKYIATLLNNTNPELDGYLATLQAEAMVRDVCADVFVEGRVYDVVWSKRSSWRRSLELLKTVCQSVRIKQ